MILGDPKMLVQPPKNEQEKSEGGVHCTVQNGALNKKWRCWLAGNDT